MADRTETPKRIQLRRTRGWRKPEGAIVVARPTRYGNPYRFDDFRDVYPHADEHELRRMAVSDFRGMLEGRWDAPDGPAPYPQLADVRAELAGHDLACWCPLVDAAGNPVPCHADVLLEIANESLAVSRGCSGGTAPCKTRCGNCGVSAVADPRAELRAAADRTLLDIRNDYAKWRQYEDRIDAGEYGSFRDDEVADRETLAGLLSDDVGRLLRDDDEWHELKAERDGLRAELAAARREVEDRDRNRAYLDDRWLEITGDLQTQLADTRRTLAKAERWITNCVRPEDVGREVKVGMMKELRAAAGPSSPHTENSSDGDAQDRYEREAREQVAGLRAELAAAQHRTGADGWCPACGRQVAPPVVPAAFHPSLSDTENSSDAKADANGARCLDIHHRYGRCELECGHNGSHGCDFLDPPPYTWPVSYPTGYPVSENSSEGTNHG